MKWFSPSGELACEASPSALAVAPLSPERLDSTKGFLAFENSGREKRVNPHSCFGLMLFLLLLRSYRFTSLRLCVRVFFFKEELLAKLLS